MRVAVTGAAGKLGREVVRELTFAKHEVRCIDRTEAAGIVAADLRELSGVKRCLAGVDAIVHLAAWPTPTSAAGSAVFSDNVLMASNVLFAAAELGIRNVTVASSQSVLGLAWSAEVVEPDYLPVDEKHPCRPGDVYSLSKLVTEQLSELLSAQDRIDAKLLRFPVIWDPAEFEGSIAGRLHRPSQGAKSQWAYVDLRDAARAVRLALAVGRPGYEVFNITSQNVFAAEPAAELVARWYPRLAKSGGLPADCTACFDWRAARDRLGFVCRYRWSVDGIEDLGAAD